MREILFRGRTIREKWVYGNLIKTDKGYLINHSLDFAAKVIPNAKYAFALFEDEISAVPKNTISQYTGLKDKNGKMIFEGDLFKIGAEKDTFEVVYEPGCFLAYCNGKQYGLLGELMMCFVEIIGNIHDNPELITNPK